MKFKINKERVGRLNTIGNILPSIIKEFNLEQSFLIERIRKDWTNIVGDLIATHSKPDRIFKKVLFIHVDHAVFSNELSLMRDMIISEINERMGVKIINNLRMEVKKIIFAGRKKSDNRRDDVHTCWKKDDRI
ncbi:MAG: DUF721 domain-containing protein [Spirochaetota bacterium]|nr:DUF721 domain-containing protein [Spirochaetota bacterium]